MPTLADDILRLVQMRIVAIWTRGYKIATERVTPNRVRQRGEILAELRRLVADSALTDTAFREQASAIVLPEQGGPPPIPMRKQLTGEPVAGELHTGSGGRGRR